MVDQATQCRVIRAITGWDARTLAERMDCNPNTITNWEKGRSVPRGGHRDTLAEICQEWGIAIRPDGMPVLEMD